MDVLQVKANQIIDSQGRPVHLHGTCVGGWMNMEHFIDGYPGDEHGQRAAMAQVLGPGKAQFFFDRWLDYFFAEEDVAFIKSCGATAVRLSLNYRHFERDDEPFKYLEAGFARLERAVNWCAKHGLYVIFDLHSAQGWQNTDWHCDNSSRHSFFWQHSQFQDRFVALWEEFARRYKGNPAVAGYNVMNEPVTNAPNGRFGDAYTPDWDTINRVYRRVVSAIRAIDSDHIVFLEGDLFSVLFTGLDAPFAENLVYSSHNYIPAAFGPGCYPGEIAGELWDRQKQVQVFQEHQGFQFTQQHHVPLWVGEFGPNCAGPVEEFPDRLRALDEQIDVFEEHGAHWTTWTYKDIGAMGWVQVAPEAEYLQRIASISRAKRLLGVDLWLPSNAATSRDIVADLAHYVEEVIADSDIETQGMLRYMRQAVLSGYVASLMQPAYAKCFKGMSEAELDRVLQSFAFKNCKPCQGLVDVIRKHGARPA